jgi:uncharacterized membrane protein YedE/YeeE
VIVAIVISAVAGLIFGLGLIISGMSDPAKVQNFLDLFGAWDPSLAFVMAGAIAVTFVGYRVAFGRGRPLLTDSFSLPTKTTIDPSLVGGAALFGVGWGLSGFCPGPAIVSLPLLATGTLVFVPAMLVGMVLARALQQKKVALAPSEATNG